MKSLKKIAKAFIVAFSIYSKIPMPRFNWESDDMKYHLCFFPWVGAVIGGVEFLWYLLCEMREIGTVPFVFVALAIPILITGGFHLDGFMDTCDALHSYQDREKKLEILKDPHIGAFAVICLAAFFCLAAGALALVYEVLDFQDVRAVIALCMCFFLARTLSGISVVTMPGAKKKGMLQTFSDTAGKKTVMIVLIAELILIAAGMVAVHPILGGVSILAAGGSFAYYHHVSMKQFGGITGDLAGYFVSLTEIVIICGAAIAVLLRG